MKIKNTDQMRSLLKLEKRLEKENSGSFNPHKAEHLMNRIMKECNDDFLIVSIYTTNSKAYKKWGLIAALNNVRVKWNDEEGIYLIVS